MNLMRSVPRDFKGGVRELVNFGWTMYKLNELTPNKTRRAQVDIVVKIYCTFIAGIIAAFFWEIVRVICAYTVCMYQLQEEYKLMCVCMVFIIHICS